MAQSHVRSRLPIHAARRLFLGVSAPCRKQSDISGAGEEIAMTTGLAATTWADLSALTGSTAGEAAWVFGPDAGTHTDPVTSATVSNVGVYAWSVSPAGWQQVAPLSASAEPFIVVTDPPPTPDTGTSQIALEYIYPDRIDGDGTHTDIPARINVSYGPYAAGDVPGAPKFTDLGYNFGFNATSTGSPEMAGLPVFEHRMEWKFYGQSFETGNPVVPWAEDHIQYTTLQGDINRLFSAILPWNSHDRNWVSQAGWRAAVHTLYAGNGQDFIWQITAFGDAGTSVPTVHLGTATSFVHPTNNYPWCKQLNTTGNALNLPYIDNRNHLGIQQGIEHVVSAWTANSVGVQSAHAITCIQTPNNARLRYLSFNGTSLATISDVETQGSASTVVRWNLENTHASGAARLDVTGNGDQAVRVVHTASGRNGTFKLTNSGQRFEVAKPDKYPTK